jgi:hypothetical protein
MSCRGRISCLKGKWPSGGGGGGCVLRGCSNGGCARPVKSAESLNAPLFREGVLKVFRNTLTNDLRFYCRVDRESETYWSKLS